MGHKRLSEDTSKARKFSVSQNVRPLRRTERSHEENQERAYIAASRRTDRSVEARVQSARMASDIHKRRTGKAFRITEDIVLKEEMYEEEDDDFPRSYRILGPHMQTSSADMNARVDTYLSNRVAMSQLLSATEADWRENEINRTFAQFFPEAQNQARRLAQRWSGPPPPSHHERIPNNPLAANEWLGFGPVTYQEQARNGERSQSFAAVSPSAEHGEGLPTSPATVGSGSLPDTPQPRNSYVPGHIIPPRNPMLDFGPDNSAFTSELPPEARMFMGAGDLDPSGAWIGSRDWQTPTLDLVALGGLGSKQPHGQHAAPSHQYVPNNTYTAGNMNGEVESKTEPIQEYLDYLGSLPSNDFANPPTYNPEEPPWDNFIDDNAWAKEE